MTRLEHQNCSQICLIRTILPGSGMERNLESFQGQVSLLSFLMHGKAGCMYIYENQQHGDTLWLPLLHCDQFQLFPIYKESWNIPHICSTGEMIVVLGRDDLCPCWVDHITTRFVKFLQTRSVSRWRESRTAGKRTLLGFFLSGVKKNTSRCVTVDLMGWKKIKVSIYSHLGPILVVLLSGMRWQSEPCGLPG